MSIFLNQNLRPATVGFKLVEAVSVEISAITGISADNVQAALAAIYSDIPQNAASLSFAPTTDTTSNTVQLAIQELQTDINSMDTQGTLTASERRGLQEITEGTSFNYTDIPGAMMAVSDGLTNPSPFGSFIYPYTGVTNNQRIFFEVPLATSIANAVIRRFNAAGDVTAEIDVSGETQQSGANTGMLRYLTFENIPILSTETLRLQNKLIQYDTYTLSTKYRLPVAGLIGAISETQLDPSLRAILADLEDTTFSLNDEVYQDQITVTRTVPDNIFGEIRHANNHTLSNNASDYTIAVGANVPVNAGGFTYFLIPENTEVLSVIGNSPVEVYTFQYLGHAVTGFRAYRAATQNATSSVLTVKGGAPTNIKAVFSDKVEIQLQNLSASLKKQLIKNGHSSFFDHVQVSGQLTNLANASDFYVLPFSSLPQRTLSSWTHITNSVFPQPTLTTPTRYVVLLNDKYPNRILWDSDNSQPTPSGAQPSISTLTRGQFEEVDGGRVPDGFAAFSFTMPPWNAASTARTGQRIEVGDITDGNVDRIDMSSVFKVTDNNIEVHLPTTVISQLQQDKLKNLQVKTYIQRAATIGVPNADYDTLLASAWPDPDIDYNTEGQGAVLGQRPAYTGIRENGLGEGRADFFNLVTNANISLTDPSPSMSSHNWLGHLVVASDTAGCAGIIGGTIMAEDNNTTPRLRIDDDEGVMAVMTLHVNHGVLDGSYEIMNIGNPGANAANGLILRKLTGNLSLLVREYTGNPTNTSRQVEVRDPLEAPNGAVSQIYRRLSTDPSPLNVPHDWEVANNLQTGVGNEVQYQMFLRLWDNDNDLGEVDVSGSIPSAFQSMATFISSIAATNFTIDLTPFTFDIVNPPTGFSATMQYWGPSDGANPSPGERTLRLTFNGLTNPAVYAEIHMFAVTTQVITVPAGTTRDVEIVSTLNGHFDSNGVWGYDTNDRTYELGFYVRSQDQPGAAVGRTLRYQVAIDGSTSDEVDSAEVAPTGKIPVTFGNIAGDLAFNRFAIFKPNAPLRAAVMNDLTSRTLRNREEAGGLLRHVGGTYHETFSTAYRAVKFVNISPENLKNATASHVNWRIDDTVPELSVTSSTEELLAETNFSGYCTVSIGLQFDQAAINTANLAQRAYLLLEAVFQEKLPGDVFKSVDGPKLYDEIPRSFFVGTERPEATNTADPLVRREFTTAVQFKAGAIYRVQVTGHRLLAGTTNPWPTADSVVILATGESYLQIQITPKV